MEIHVHLTFEDFAAAQRAHYGAGSWLATLVFGCILLLVLGAPLFPNMGRRFAPPGGTMPRRPPARTTGTTGTMPRLPANFRRTLALSALLADLVSILVLSLPLLLLAWSIWAVIRRSRSGKSNRPWDRPNPENASRFNRAMNWIVPAFIYIATALVMAVRIRAIAVQYQLMAAIGGQADASSIAELVVGTVPILIIFGGIIFFQKPLMRIVRRANWRAQTNLHRPTTFEFSPDGMIETHELARCEYRWEFFPGFRESRETFLVYPSAMMFHIFPKRAFANPAEVDEFRAMLDEKIRKVTYAFPVVRAKELPLPLPPLQTQATDRHGTL